MPVERQFGIVGAGKLAAQIYIEVVSIDPLNDAMQLRVSLEFESGAWRRAGHSLRSRASARDHPR